MIYSSAIIYVNKRRMKELKLFQLVTAAAAGAASLVGVLDDKARAIRRLDVVELELLELLCQFLAVDKVDAVGVCREVILGLIQVERGSILGARAACTGEVDPDHVVSLILFC